MTNNSGQTAWTGAYATPDLIGRRDVLSHINATVRAAADAPQIILITGEGGIGKTRVILETLKHETFTLPVKIANRLIDLYDIQTHSIANLIENIVNVLTTSAVSLKDYKDFKDYKDLRRELDEAEATETLLPNSDLRERTFQAFIKNLTDLARQQRIIIAFDTAERMLYSNTKTASDSVEVARAYTWLIEHIPEIPNITWIVAGREEAHVIIDNVSSHPNVHIEDIKLKPLTLEDTIGYFQAVAKVAEVEEDSVTLSLIQSFSPEEIERAHQYSHGRPILLALLVDLMVVQGLNIEAALSNHGSRPNSRRMDKKIEGEVILRLIQPEDDPLVATLLAVGRLRKGANEVLVRAVLGATMPEISRQPVGEFLKRLEKLSFVKKRDQKIFFHDVMYEMLDEYYYSAEDLRAANRALDAINNYYREQELLLQHAINAVFAPVEKEQNIELFDRDKLIELNQRRRVLLPENLYYRLKQDAAAGFRLYVRNTFDAILSSDSTLDAQLETEIMAFLKEEYAHNIRRANKLDRETVEGIALLRPVARAFADNQQGEAQAAAAQLRRDPQLEIGGPATTALLNIWQAYSLTYLGGKDNISKGRMLLDEAIAILGKIVEQTQTAASARDWRAKVGLAFAYQVRAYLNWTREALSEAVADGKRAVQLGREVKVWINLATALNDLGFMLAETGNTRDGHALVNEALDIRRKVGSRAAVAFSLNASALIDLREGIYSAAIDQSTQALLIFRALDHKRGTLLALLAVAEARRRHSQTSNVPVIARKLEMLLKAKEQATEALELAQDTEEKVRQIEAQIEIGCALRDRVRILKQEGVTDENIPRLIKQSQEALIQAAELAGEDFMYRRADALVNLGFLGYYARDNELAAGAIEYAEKVFPDPYRIQPETGQPTIDREQAAALLWTQLGKLHTLRGHIAFEQYRTESQDAVRQARLNDVIKYYLLSLEYNTLYNPDHPGLRMMSNQVFDRMKTVPVENLHRVAARVIEVEAEYHKQGSSLLRKLLQNRALWYGSN